MKNNLKLETMEIPYYLEHNKLMDKAVFLADEHDISGSFRGSKYLLKRLKNHILQLLALIMPYNKTKINFQRKRGVRIGKNVTIGPFVHIDGEFPNYCILEDGCSLAGYNIVLTHFQPLEYHKKVFKSFVAPTTIKKNATIAIGVIILPGTTVGEGSTVAAGAVVTKDIPPFVLAGGVPAKVLKEFEMKDGIPIGFKK